MEKGPVFGLSIGDLLTIYDPDSQSWKMSECLFTGDYAKYSEALPKSGMMRNGKIYEQATWVRRTVGKESGFWLTPSVEDAGRAGTPEAWEKYEKENITTNARLRNQVAKFPTPHSNCHTGAGKRGDCGENLQTAVKFPTPRQTDADRGGRGDLIQAVRGNENSHFKLFPTPCARDHMPAHKPEYIAKKKAEGHGMAILPDVVQGNGGQLNPTWVDWLMGYPIGWTDLKDSETRLSLK